MSRVLSSSQIESASLLFRQFKVNSIECGLSPRPSVPAIRERSRSLPKGDPSLRAIHLDSPRLHGVKPSRWAIKPA